MAPKQSSKIHRKTNSTLDACIAFNIDFGFYMISETFLEQLSTQFQKGK